MEQLQGEILGLEREKQLGRRAIDVVDSDILTTQTQITQLRRKYLNYFYYF